MAEQTPSLPVLEAQIDQLGGPGPTHLGERRSGSDDRGPDPGALEFHLHGAAERLEACFRRVVGADVGAGRGGVLRGDEHDIAALAVDHRREHLDDEPMRSDEVGVELTQEGGGVGLVGGGGGHVARVRHEDLDGPERLLGGVGRSSDRLVVGHVERDRGDLSAIGPQHLGELLESSHPTGGEHDRVADRRERRRRRGSDTRGCARDEHRATLGMGFELTHGVGALLVLGFVVTAVILA